MTLTIYRIFIQQTAKTADSTTNDALPTAYSTKTFGFGFASIDGTWSEIKKRGITAAPSLEKSSPIMLLIYTSPQRFLRHCLFARVTSWQDELSD